MSSNSISRLTPYLRRYARALTGSQDAGDTLVRRTLQTLAAGELDLPDSLTLKIGVYRALHQGFAAMSLTDSQDTVVRDLPDERLQRLTATQRAALLLVLMEGFTIEDTAAVLGVDVDAAEDSLEAAQSSLADQLTTSVLIIEDEPIVALHLERLIGDLGHALAGHACTRDQAVSLAIAEEPGLVLADVRLADGSSGLDAVREILDAFDIPVIFITAHPEQLLTGKGAEPAFLVTKPFREETLKALIGQALFFHPGGGTGMAGERRTSASAAPRDETTERLP